MISIFVIMYALLFTFILSVYSTNYSDFFEKVYGHGLSRDESLPFNVSGQQIAIEAKLEPSFLNENNQEPRFLLRTFDLQTNETIGDVNYRIIANFKNDTVLDQRFHATDGIILANMIPSNDSNTQHTTYKDQQQTQLSKDDLLEVSLTNPVKLKSKILSDGGLYQFKVIVEKSSNGIKLESDKTVDLYISIGKAYPFVISENKSTNTTNNSNGTNDSQRLIFKVKSFYDEITDFKYDKENSKISFKMPFTWNLDYVDQVVNLHEELVIPKSYIPLSTVGAFTGTLNDMEIPPNFILVDDFSVENDRVVHIVIPKFKLTEYADKIMKYGENSTVIFEIQPIVKN
ncbi:MAG: hypothetical protein ACE5SW_10890 [Nitrososphaeraceae archaeon]